MIRAGEASARTLTRAHILLLTDQGATPRRMDGESASALFCSLGTVRSIRRRFHEEGLQAALVDKPRPGAVPKVTGEVEAKLTMLACSTPSEGYARWTLRLLAEEMVRLEYIGTISHVTVGEHLKKQSATLESSLLVHGDVLEVYQRPHDPQRPVVCLDEKSKELHSTPRGTLPMARGQEAREDYAYARHGTANLFLAVEPLVGRRNAARVTIDWQFTAADVRIKLKRLHPVVKEQNLD